MLLPRQCASCVSVKKDNRKGLNIMGKTYEESFASILNNHGFEMRKSNDAIGAYFLYDTWNNAFYPNLETLVASEDFGLGLKEACKDLSIEPDKDGNYRLAYHGGNEEYATLFESTIEERTEVLAPLAKKCDLDVDELLNAITSKDTTELVAKIEQTYNIFHNNSEIREQYILDICRDCEGSPYLRRCPLNNLGDVLALEEQLLANKDTDPEAKKTLEILSVYIDDVRFLLNVDIDALNLDTIYAAQEASKGEYHGYVKADKPTKTKQDVER